MSEKYILFDFELFLDHKQNKSTRQFCNRFDNRFFGDLLNMGTFVGHDKSYTAPSWKM